MYDSIMRRMIHDSGGILYDGVPSGRVEVVVATIRSPMVMASTWSWVT